MKYIVAIHGSGHYQTDGMRSVNINNNSKNTNPAVSMMLWVKTQ